MAKLNPIIGRKVPGGPMKTGIPAFGGQLPRADRKAAGMKVGPRASHQSKKAYRGTLAGIGRGGRAILTKDSRGPMGPQAIGPRPSRFAGSVQLGNRTPYNQIPKAARPKLIPSLLKRARAALGRA